MGVEIFIRGAIAQGVWVTKVPGSGANPHHYGSWGTKSPRSWSSLRTLLTDFYCRNFKISIQFSPWFLTSLFRDGRHFAGPSPCLSLPLVACGDWSKQIAHMYHILLSSDHIHTNTSIYENGNSNTFLCPPQLSRTEKDSWVNNSSMGRHHS